MWKRTLTYQITKSHEAFKTIHDFLKTHGYSSSVIRHLKETENGIMKNGRWARVSEVLMLGDILTVTLTEESSSEHIVPSNLPLPIVYEDEDLLIINKPARMPIHPSQGHFDHTLANACAWHFKQKGEPFTYRCINRLDRDTTGLLIVARHKYSASVLSTMVAQRQIHREYLAISEGLVPDQGTITAPIGRVEGSTIEREVNFESGEYACTHFRRLAYGFDVHKTKKYSLVALKLDTGRTHQIRVHMKYIGHPLPGDFLYHPDDRVIDRQALHSWRLSFPHPITEMPMNFTAPLPDDMAISPDFLLKAMPN